MELIATGSFEAAAIDAPFSLPLKHLPPGGHAALLDAVRHMPNGPDREFPLGPQIVELGEAFAAKDKHKPLRETEAHWAARGVNVRSTMWSGPRGGAPFAAACLRLIERAGRPIWPWDSAKGGILGEAFPAGQLRHWEMPHHSYSKRTQVDVRQKILDGLRERECISFDRSAEETMKSSPDALDATIAGLAAIAIMRDVVPDFTRPSEEGFIAIAP